MDHGFPEDYFAARDAFRAHARHGNAASRAIRAVGPNNETLTVDCHYVGATAPRRLVLLTSGVHGIEGYAGSALQQLWLNEFSDAALDETGFFLVHAINPYGFAHGRRVNENNVDLNRNALAQFPGPANAGYRALDGWLNPPSPVPRVDGFIWGGLRALWRHGYKALAQAAAAGQYEFPRGLFYGGREQEESLAIFSEWLLHPRFRSAETVWHLDLHTGLGEYGRYQILSEEAPGSHAFEACVSAFGANRVKSDHASSTTHYSASGILSELTHRSFPAAKVIAATVEFGTLDPSTMLRVLRAENRLHHFGARNPKQARRIREALRETAAPRDLAWRKAVVAGGREIFAKLNEHLSKAD